MPRVKRILLILSVTFALAVVVSTLLATISFRQEGPVFYVRVALGLTAFVAWGAWILLSVIALPHALLEWRHAHHAGRSVWPASCVLLGGLAPLVLLGTLAVCAPRWSCLRMPGTSWHGPLPPLTGHQTLLRANLQHDVRWLSADLGERNAIFSYTNLCLASEGISNTFSRAGYAVRTVDYVPDHWAVRGRVCRTIEAERRGIARPDDIVVIGAHYDTVDGTPGADDNASGVAALLALAGTFADAHPACTLRFVAFANEEPPFFFSREMGSYVYASECRRRAEKITAMICLESVGRYSDTPGSQKYPTSLLERFFPTSGHFIGFIGNTASRQLVWDALGAFRRHAQFPSEGAALPALITGVGWSDHWAFWQFGYPAIMVTDTAPFRNLQYHTAQDTWDRLDYDRLARVVDGLSGVVRDLTGMP